jgi:hypothetical protein
METEMRIICRFAENNHDPVTERPADSKAVYAGITPTIARARAGIRDSPEPMVITGKSACPMILSPRAATRERKGS